MKAATTTALIIMMMTSTTKGRLGDHRFERRTHAHGQPGKWWAKRDDGVTLVELMVVIAITSVVGLLLVGTLIMVGNLVTKTGERTEEFIDAKQALEEISANLRGATNADQGRGRLTDANSQAIVFYTASGEGLNAQPQLMAYIVIHNTLFHIIPGPNADWKNPISNRVVLRGVTNQEAFEFYTWADPNAAPNSPGSATELGNRCFRKLTHAELTKPNPNPSENGDASNGINARNSIAGVRITLNVKQTDNIRFKEQQGHSTWVRLGESIEPKDPMTGALIPGWPQNCWETFEHTWEQ